VLFQCLSPPRVVCAYHLTLVLYCDMTIFVLFEYPYDMDHESEAKKWIPQSPLLKVHLGTWRFGLINKAGRFITWGTNFRHSHAHKWVWPTVLSLKVAEFITRWITLTGNELFSGPGPRVYLRLINKELSNLWKIPTPEGHNISDQIKSSRFTIGFKGISRLGSAFSSK